MCIFIRSPPTWIGLVSGPSGPCTCGTAGTAECDACRRSWVWSDGTIFDYDKFQDWASNEPDISESCAYFYYSSWRGYECSTRYGFMCKIGKLKIHM